MSEMCAFCGKPVNPHDLNAYKRVIGWVHGKRKDSMTLREDTGEYAHEKCVLKAKGGNTPDQPDLFGEDGVTPEPSPVVGLSSDRLEELFDKVLPPPTIAGLGEMLGLNKKIDDNPTDTTTESQA